MEMSLSARRGDEFGLVAESEDVHDPAPPDAVKEIHDA
jgi:hypothetical protein